MAEVIRQATEPTIDLTAIYITLKDQYRNVFMEKIGDQVFFYRSIGRKEYQLIIEDPDMNDFQRENVICDVCVLYPKPYDWNNCDAGIPEKLVEVIRKNSFLDSVESRQQLLGYYRSEMFDLDNQITCMINEAFPQFDIEEIEEWDVERATKYLSRAEWKLHNLRGLQFVQAEGDYYDKGKQKQQTQQNTTQKATASPSPSKQERRNEPNDTTIRGDDKRTAKLTPDKIKEMEEFRKKFPEFGSEWGAQYKVDVAYDDDYKNYGTGSLEHENVDKLAPALRTPGGGPKAPEVTEEDLMQFRERAWKKQNK